MNPDNVVYKYQFPNGSDESTFKLFSRDVVLHADMQDETFCIWVLTDTGGGERIDRTFILRGTGHKFPSGRYQHVSTALIQDGRFVFHVFERLAS